MLNNCRSIDFSLKGAEMGIFSKLFEERGATDGEWLSPYRGEYWSHLGNLSFAQCEGAVHLPIASCCALQGFTSAIIRRDDLEGVGFDYNGLIIPDNQETGLWVVVNRIESRDGATVYQKDDWTPDRGYVADCYREVPSIISKIRNFAERNKRSVPPLFVSEWFRRRS